MGFPIEKTWLCLVGDFMVFSLVGNMFSAQRLTSGGCEKTHGFMGHLWENRGKIMGNPMVYGQHIEK